MFGMHTAIVKTEDQFRDAVALAAKRGLQVACISNAGLKDGWQRITFLPESAFVKKDDVSPTEAM